MTKKSAGANPWLPTLSDARLRAAGWGDCSDDGFVEGFVLYQELLRVEKERDNLREAIEELLAHAINGRDLMESEYEDQEAAVKFAEAALKSCGEE